MELRCFCSTGNEAPTSRSLISEFIRPLQVSGDKPELLSVKPTFLTRGRASSPARALLSEVYYSVHLYSIFLHVRNQIDSIHLKQMESNKLWKDGLKIPNDTVETQRGRIPNNFNRLLHVFTQKHFCCHSGQWSSNSFCEKAFYYYFFFKMNSPVLDPFPRSCLCDPLRRRHIWENAD